MPFWEIVLIIAVLSAGGFVQSISGFGYALFTSPIISAFIAPSRAVVIIAIANLFSSMRNLARGRDEVSWKPARNMTAAALAGMPLGIVVLEHVGANGLRLVIGIVVAAIAFRWIYAENGLINGWLGALLGDHFTAIGFLTSPLLALPSVMVVTLWKGLGYYMVIFLAGLQGISADLYEAASLDGSEGWRKHCDITLPLLRPYITLVAVISAIAATKVFEEVYLMTQGGPADATRTMVYYVYDQAFSELEISYACTLGLALFLIVLLLSLIRFVFAADRGVA